MKEIRKDGFVYKVAYGLDKYPPEKTSACRLFWKFVFMLFAWPALFIMLGVMWGLSCALAFFVASKLKFPNGRLVFYERWPEIKGHRVWPITVLIVAVVLWLIYRIIFSTAAKTAAAFGVSHLDLIIAGLVIIGVVAAAFANRYLREIVNLTVDYLRAKKNKVCPIVKFVDAESKEEK